MSEAEKIDAVFKVHLQYMDRRFNAIEEKIDNLCLQGCELGRSHTKEIAAIHEAQKGAAQRAGSVAGGLASFIIAVGYGIIEYIRSK